MDIKKLDINGYKFDGQVILTDPCYVLGHVSSSPYLWSEFCNLLFANGGGSVARDGTFFEVDGYVMFVCDTKDGDGCYPVTDKQGSVIGNLSVDAGMLSVMPQGLVDRIKEFDRWDLVLVADGGDIEVLGEGDFKVGDLTVTTSKFYEELEMEEYD